MEGGSKNLYCHGGGVISLGVAIRLRSEKLYCHGGGVQKPLLPWRGGHFLGSGYLAWVWKPLLPWRGGPKTSITMEGGSFLRVWLLGLGPKTSIAMEGGSKMTYWIRRGPEILGEVMGEWVIPRVG